MPISSAASCIPSPDLGAWINISRNTLGMAGTTSATSPGCAAGWAGSPSRSNNEEQKDQGGSKRPIEYIQHPFGQRVMQQQIEHVSRSTCLWRSQTRLGNIQRTVHSEEVFR